ncbi:MAG: polyprenyl synthetase family protein [Candidatus Micrarchaeaceae archaeon]
MALDFSSVRMPKDVSSAIVEVNRKISGFGLNAFRNRELYEPSAHLLRSRGKLMRPSLVLLGAHVTYQKASSFVDLAAAAELLHISSLIHDDIIDKDSFRRGLKAVHVKFGVEPAILAGDALIAKAIFDASKYGEEVVCNISNAAMDMCAGEALDFAFQKKGMVPRKSDYIKIAELKSASLIASCCNIAAVYKKDAIARNLYSFGRNIGIAFQMRDDILDGFESADIDSKSKRPNIVVTLMEHSSLKAEEARERATELHNQYIDKAISELGNFEFSDLLASYADAVRIK